MINKSMSRISNIECTGNINTNTLSYSSGDFFKGITSNIQDQLNQYSSPGIIYNDTNSLSGLIYNNFKSQNLINLSLSSSIYVNNISQNLINLSISSLVYNNNNTINNYVLSLRSSIYVNNISQKLMNLSLSSSIYVNNITQNNNIISLSSLIYNSNTSQNLINLSISNLIYKNTNDILTLSGLIHTNDIIYYGFFNSFTSSISNLNTSSSNTSSVTSSLSSKSTGNTLLGILNGVGTAGLGVACAFIFFSMGNSIMLLNAEVTDLKFETTVLENQMSNTNIEINKLKRDIQDLKTKTCFLNGTTFNSDLIVQGQKTLNSNVTVNGYINSFRDFLQF